MTNIPILSFNSGELTPLIDARADVEKYSSGCRHLENFIPRIYGSAERRPGLKYVNRQYWTDTSVRLIPFIYSSDTAYAIELGNLYARPFEYLYWEGDKVYYEGDEVFDCWTPITTTYLTADLFQIQYKQLGNTMWNVHPDYAPKKLTRTSTTSFEIEDISFFKGPFLTRNDLVNPDVTDTAYMDIATGSPLSINQGITGGAYMGGYSRAQTFTAPYDIKCSYIKIKMWRVATYTGTVTVAIMPLTIQVVATGHPTGTGFNNAYATGTLTEADITSTTQPGELYTVTLSNTIELESGKLYGIAVYATQGANPGVDFVWWATGVQTLYTEGQAWYGVPAWPPTDWGTYGYTFGFEIWGTATISGGDYATGTMVCENSSAAAISYFESGHVGSLFKLTFPRESTVSKGSLTGANVGVLCAAIDVKGTFKFNTHGNWDATVRLQRRENSSQVADWEDYRTYTSKVVNGAGDRNVQFAGTEDADGVEYRAYVETGEHTSGTINADITVDNSTEDTIVLVNSLVDATTANIMILSGTIVAEHTRRWAEGAWSPKRGYPTSVTFFEDRCVYAGMKTVQAQVTPDYVVGGGADEPKLVAAWLSKTGDYENFEAGVKDSDSFELVLPSTNDVKWIESLSHLLVGTASDEWKIGTNNLDTPLTPTNYTVKQQSSFGSRSIQAVKVNEQVLFVDFVGRKVRELTFDGDKYVAPDLTALAEHITLSGIVDMAYQRSPDSILWCVLDNGTLVGMTYERDQNVVAWHKCPIDGDVQSVCVVPAAGESEVWISVKRTIGGSDIVFIEKFMPRNFGDSVENAFFVDSGVTYSNAEIVYSGDDVVYWEGSEVLYGDAFSTIKNLEHLEGEIVDVLVDGVVYKDLGVTNGTATLPTGVTGLKAQVGKSYTSKLEPMKPVVNTQMGSSAASIVSCKEMGISLVNTMDAKYGASDGNLMDINFDDARWENSCDISGLFTGTVAVSVDGGFSIDNNLIISTDAPLPCVVRALIPKVEVTSR